MSLSPGAHLGRYEIVALLGSGGMGEVYRAHDASLRRDVAIKVLRDALAADLDGLRRFEQEALATAALNHPNILAVYDVGTDEGNAFVVSELLDGRTLRDVLAGGTLPLRKAVDYAAQIASGLAAAHEKGIVHRDLKPENLFVTRDDRVRILDFGIARILEHSPLEGVFNTGSAPTMTVAGTMLGTVGYMAPEQVRGEAVDHRADIFSFGAVFYEMLTRRRAFHRETVPGTLAAILDADPPTWTGDGSAMSLRALRLVHRCLEKAPSARFQSARDIALVLSDEGTDTSAASPVRSRRGLSLSLTLAAAAVLFAALGAWAWSRFGSPRVDPAVASPVSFEIALPAGATAWNFHPAISDAGQRIVFGAVRDRVARLYVRELTSVDARELPGTEGANHQPFFAPDGMRVGFFADDQLKSTSISLGLPHVICPAAGARGGAWGDDDVIVFASGIDRTSLSRVAASGGTPELMTVLDPTRDESSHRFPRLLPGNRGVLFTVQDSKLATSVAVQAAGSKTHTILVEHGAAPQYAQGQLIYVNDHNEVMAAPFDPVRLQLTAGLGAAQFQRATEGANIGDSSLKVALNGAMVYLPYAGPAARSLTIVTRQGRAQPVPGQPLAFGSPSISPDGKRIAVAIQTGLNEFDVWVGDEGGHFSPLTTDRKSRFPIWNPDGDHVTYASTRNGILNVFSQRVDGQGPAEQLTAATTEAYPYAWSPNGQSLIFGQSDAHGVTVILRKRIGDPAPPSVLVPLKSTAYARASPDGRWLAYTTDVSGHGQWELYVTSLPSPDRVFPVSQGAGGRQMTWSKSSDELLFRRLSGQLVTVKMTAAGPSGGPVPVAMGDVTMAPGSAGDPQFDVFPDGRLLVMKTEVDRQAGRPMVVVLNWIANLTRK